MKNRSNETCCVVGSGLGSLPDDFNNTVDSYDVVVRINHGLEPKKMVGTKNTIYMFGSIQSFTEMDPSLIPHIKRELSGIKYVWYNPLWISPYTDRWGVYMEGLLKEYAPNSLVSSALDINSYMELISILSDNQGRKIRPTSGMCAIYRCLQDYIQVSIIGFGGLNDKLHRRSPVHSFQSENSYLRRLIKSGDVVLLDCEKK